MTLTKVAITGLSKIRLSIYIRKINYMTDKRIALLEGLKRPVMPYAEGSARGGGKARAGQRVQRTGEGRRQ